MNLACKKLQLSYIYIDLYCVLVTFDVLWESSKAEVFWMKVMDFKKHLQLMPDIALDSSLGKGCCSYTREIDQFAIMQIVQWQKIKFYACFCNIILLDR